MEHYGPSSWQEIQTNILPTKTLKQVSGLSCVSECVSVHGCVCVHACVCVCVRVFVCNNLVSITMYCITHNLVMQLKLRVKNRCSKRSGSNVIKVSMCIKFFT